MGAARSASRAASWKGWPSGSTMAAERITPDAINFMITHARGLVCLSMTPQRLDELDVPLVVAENSSRRGTPTCGGGGCGTTPDLPRDARRPNRPPPPCPPGRRH